MKVFDDPLILFLLQFIFFFILLQGFRNLADLQSAGVLNRIQQIGLKYYQEFKERMPRSEVEQIEERVNTIWSVLRRLPLLLCLIPPSGEESMSQY